jgi:hypothetical protein
VAVRVKVRVMSVNEICVLVALRRLTKVTNC